MHLVPHESREHPWSCDIWNGKLTVAFGYAESGWILMAIMTTTFNRSVVVHCSEIFDPFPAMQNWLEQIVKKQLPADWEIDEEGKKTLLRVKADKDDQLDLQVWSFPYPEDPNYPPKLKLRARVERIQLLKEFYRRFTQYVREDFDPQHWPMEPEWIRSVRECIFGLRNVDLSLVLRSFGDSSQNK